MEFDRVVRKRQSTRQFKKKKPDFRHVLAAIDQAQQGPFAGNHNHLRYLIVEDSHTIKELSGLSEQPWIVEAPMLVVICSDDTALEDLYGERGRVYSRHQAGAAVQTFLLGLTDNGIDSCWVGAYGDELIREKLGIPQHIQIEAIVPIGYSSRKIKKPKKKSFERSLFWELWGQDRRPTIFEEDLNDYRPE